MKESEKMCSSDRDSKKSTSLKRRIDEVDNPINSDHVSKISEVVGGWETSLLQINALLKKLRQQRSIKEATDFHSRFLLAKMNLHICRDLTHVMNLQYEQIIMKNKLLQGQRHEELARVSVTEDYLTLEPNSILQIDEGSNLRGVRSQIDIGSTLNKVHKETSTDAENKGHGTNKTANILAPDQKTADFHRPDVIKTIEAQSQGNIHTASIQDKNNNNAANTYSKKEPPDAQLDKKDYFNNQNENIINNAQSKDKDMLADNKDKNNTSNCKDKNRNLDSREKNKTVHSQNKYNITNAGGENNKVDAQIPNEIHSTDNQGKGKSFDSKEYKKTAKSILASTPHTKVGAQCEPCCQNLMVETNSLQKHRKDEKDQKDKKYKKDKKNKEDKKTKHCKNKDSSTIVITDKTTANTGDERIPNSIHSTDGQDKGKSFSSQETKKTAENISFTEPLAKVSTQCEPIAFENNGHNMNVRKDKIHKTHKKDKGDKKEKKDMKHHKNKDSFPIVVVDKTADMKNKMPEIHVTNKINAGEDKIIAQILDKIHPPDGQGKGKSFSRQEIKTKVQNISFTQPHTKVGARCEPIVIENDGNDKKVRKDKIYKTHKEDKDDEKGKKYKKHHKNKDNLPIVVADKTAGLKNKTPEIHVTNKINAGEDKIIAQILDKTHPPDGQGKGKSFSSQEIKTKVQNISFTEPHTKVGARCEPIVIENDGNDKKVRKDKIYKTHKEDKDDEKEKKYKKHHKNKDSFPIMIADKTAGLKNKTPEIHVTNKINAGEDKIIAQILDKIHPTDGQGKGKPVDIQSNSKNAEKVSVTIRLRKVDGQFEPCPQNSIVQTNSFKKDKKGERDQRDKEDKKSHKHKKSKKEKKDEFKKRHGKNKDILSVANGSTIKSTESSPTLVIDSSPNLDRNSSPIMAADSSPMLVTDSSPMLVTDSSPMLVTDSSPMLVTDSSPMLVTDSSPMLVTDSSPMLVTDSSPILSLETSSIPTTDNSPILATNSVPDSSTLLSLDISPIKACEQTDMRDASGTHTNVHNLFNSINQIIHSNRAMKRSPYQSDGIIETGYEQPRKKAKITSRSSSPPLRRSPVMEIDKEVMLSGNVDPSASVRFCDADWNLNELDSSQDYTVNELFKDIMTAKLIKIEIESSIASKSTLRLSCESGSEC